MKKIMFLIISLFCSFHAFGINKIELTNPQLEEIHSKLQSIPVSFFKHFGISSKIQLDSLQIGECINLYGCSLDTSFNTCKGILKKQADFLVPIHLKSKILFFIKGKILENNIKLFGVGGDEFARNLNQILIASNINENYAILHEIISDQTFIFDENLFDKGQEFKFHLLNTSTKCRTCSNPNENWINSALFAENYVKILVEYKNKEHEIVTK